MGQIFLFVGLFGTLLYHILHMGGKWQQTGFFKNAHPAKRALRIESLNIHEASSWLKFQMILHWNYYWILIITKQVQNYWLAWKVGNKSKYRV